MVLNLFVNTLGTISITLVDTFQLKQFTYNNIFKLEYIDVIKERNMEKENNVVLHETRVFLKPYWMKSIFIVFWSQGSPL